MNKVMLIFAPVLAAGIMFGVSGASFMKSGIPETLPESVAYSSLPEKARLLLEKEIINPIQSKKKHTKSEMYSRCPSGVSHYVTASPSEKDKHYEGRVVDRVGCSSKTVCYFRIDMKQEVLEAKSLEDGEYMPVAEWKQQARGTWSF